MNHPEAETQSGMAPEPPESARDGAALRGASGFLRASGRDARRESLRIAAGLLVLAVLVVGLLNIGIHESARARIAEDGWHRLAAHTDGKRDEVLAVMARLERQARYVAEQPMVLDWARLAVEERLFETERQDFVSELDRSAASFGFEGMALHGADGRLLVNGTSADHTGQEIARLVQDVVESNGTRVTEVHHGLHALPELSMGMPVRARHGDEVEAVLVCHAQIDETLLPVLTSWPGFGSSAGAYLVTREEELAVFLSAPPGPDATWQGKSARFSTPGARAAVMAAVGIESDVEMAGSDGRIVWAVTRKIPDLGWGLVGQVDRAAMMSGLRGTVIGLLVLDLVLAVLAVSAIVFWRRQYASGLARRETEVTRMHVERVQAVFDNAFDAIVTFGKDGRLLAANRAAERLFGRSANEMLDEPIHRFLPPVVRDEHDASGDGQSGMGSPDGLLADAQAGAPAAVHLTDALRSDGTLIPVEYSLGHSGEGDELIYTAVLRDVSERVEAEKRIRKFAEGLESSNRRLEEVNAQLEEASRLKSEFLANTSHELRTPLNGMLGFLQLVLDDMCDTKEEERDYLRQALQCSRHLLGLINDVLDIAKIEAGKLNLEIVPVNIHNLFDEVRTLTHVQAAQKGITLTFEPPAEESAAVRGDFGKVKQTLINLVGNSLKFTPSGRITVRATSFERLGYYRFEVEDTGIGIPKDRQYVIFQKFTQGDGSTTRRFGGTGLGLAISKSLVELMGGIIGVESDGADTGTRMYFTLPVWRDGETEDDAPDTAHVPEQISGPSGGSLALIVEDDPTFRKYLAAVLNQNGYRTIEARSAESGWLLARRMHPAIVVLDYALTSAENAILRTGWDLAERMATDSQTRHIPLIFVTGFDQEVRERLHRASFTRRPDHLVKPIDAKELLARIEALVGHLGERVVRILMADDDPSVAAYVRKVLPEDRYLLEMVSNGEQCLHVLRTQPRGFDLLLLDLMMPVVSGWDVLRELALTGAGQGLRVLILTNYPEPRSQEERRLLDEGLVLDVVPKGKVHDNPKLLGHLIDWHLQVAAERARVEESSERAA